MQEENAIAQNYFLCGRYIEERKCKKGLAYCLKKWYNIIVNIEKNASQENLRRLQ